MTNVKPWAECPLCDGDGIIEELVKVHCIGTPPGTRRVGGHPCPVCAMKAELDAAIQERDELEKQVIGDNRREKFSIIRVVLAEHVEKAEALAALYKTKLQHYADESNWEGSNVLLDCWVDPTSGPDHARRGLKEGEKLCLEH